MKKMRIKIVAILLSCILLANSFSVNINAEEQDLSYEAEIMPVNSKGRNTSTGLRIKIIPSTEKFVHGAGFQNNLYCAPSSIPSGGSRQITLTGTAKVGYHYIYIDETGKTNNTTKYFSISNNTKLTVVNP